MFDLTRRSFLRNAAIAGVSAAAGGITAARADTPMKVGVVVQGAIGDTGWNSFHDRAWKAMEAALPGRLKATVLDNINQPQDAERVFRQLAVQDHKLIIGTTFSQYATLRKMSPTLRQSHFECSCDLFLALCQTSYLLIAILMKETFPEISRYLNSPHPMI